MKKRALAVMLAGAMVLGGRTDRCVGCIRYFRSERRRIDTSDGK